MTQTFKLLAPSFAFAAMLAGVAQAQDNASAPTPVVEIYTCTYRDGRDADDLRAVSTRFNGWADRNNMTTYTAFTATPYLFSADLEADVVWIGAWPNGMAMGVDEELYRTQGREIATAFDAVADCDAHSMYAEVVINQPASPPPQNGVAMFEDCSVHDGRTVEEALTALGQWVEYTKASGSDEFSAVLFPLAGLTNDADYDFKIVTGFASLQAFGKGVDMYTGGGFRRGEELFGRLLTCNSPRVYNLDRVRLAEQPPTR